MLFFAAPLTMDTAFCGGVSPGLYAMSSDPASGVAMQVKARRWMGGKPNNQEMEQRKATFPSLNNLKDQYFIIFARSPKIRRWYPINIISGNEASKTMKKMTDNDIAKAVGANRLAEGQVVKAIGMNLYKQKDEVKKSAQGMHKPLQYSAELEFGWKEISNNTKFNENPGPFMNLQNVSAIPPEEELKNIIDTAGEAIGTAGESVTKVGDNIKGFFGQLGGGR